MAVYGYGFLPGSGARGVAILVGVDTMVAGVEVRMNGTFTVRLPVSGRTGLLVVNAAQRDGKRLTEVRGSITVVAREEEDDERSDE